MRLQGGIWVCWLVSAGCAIEASGLAGIDGAEIDGGVVLDARGGMDARLPDGRVIDTGSIDAAAIDAPGIDGAEGGDAGIDAGRDAGAPPCPGRLFWRADFDVDPTELDVNGDGRDDWGLRSGASFPDHELSDGIWHASAGPTLDTRPLDDFRGTTSVDVRMRVDSDGSPGAVFWLNLDFTTTEMASVYVALTRVGASDQRLELRSKYNIGMYRVLDAMDLDGSFVRVELYFDARRDEVSMRVNGADRGTWEYDHFGPPTVGRTGSVLAYNARAEFDYVRIEHCPP